MNRSQILLHLSEAQEAIEQTMRDIQADPEYEYGDYSVDMTHIYHHLNTAWNSREATEGEVAEVTAGDFNRWSAFPRDLVMLQIPEA